MPYSIHNYAADGLIQQRRIDDFRRVVPAEHASIRGTGARWYGGARTLRRETETESPAAELLSDFGVLALKGTPFPDLLDQAARLVAEGPRAEFAKVLKYLPEDNRFLVCAEWVGARMWLASRPWAPTPRPLPAISYGKPVISNHLGVEERFRTPELLVQHGVRRAIKRNPSRRWRSVRGP